NRVGICEVRYFVQLPVTDRRIVVLRARRGGHHAEDRFLSAPVYARLTDRNAIGGLRAPLTETRGACQIFYGAVWISDIQITAPATAIRHGAMIAERGRDAREIPGNWDLCQKKNRIGWTSV